MLARMVGDAVPWRADSEPQVIVSFHPSGQLNVLAVLVGILMIVSAIFMIASVIFNLIGVFDPGESHRAWLGIASLA